MFVFNPVISAHRAPFPGWVEGLSGATGVVVGTGRGLLRVFHIKNEGKADVVPVDVAIDNMLAVAWETAIDRFLAIIQFLFIHMHNWL